MTDIKLMIAILVLIITMFCMSYTIIDVIKTKQLKKERVDYMNSLEEKSREFLELKKLSQREIDDIHARGLITPAEQVAEWESMDLCVPGDEIGSAKWRCKQFKNCHECLVQYASMNDEYKSMYDIIKETKIHKI